MRPILETLDSRHLLAGVTVLMHGYNGNINGWVATAAEDIASRAGGAEHASIYTMTVSSSGGSPAVTGFSANSGQADFRTTRSAELIIKLDWSSVSGGAFSTGRVAEAVSSYLLTAHGQVPALSQLPLHFIGHSRGASLAVAIAEDLGERNVYVDQLTALDPHPVDGENDFFGLSFGDQKMEVHSNVVFADNYWRTDGNANDMDFDGEPVEGMHEGNLNSTVQQNFFVSAHGAVPAYYIGTIDTDTSDGGDHPVLNGWYGGSNPSRSATGFVFTRLGQGNRPANGLNTAVGGTAPRESVDQSGSQFASVFGLRSDKSTVSAGEIINTSFKISDRDGASRVDIYLDANRNPYDSVSLLTGKPFGVTNLSNGGIGVPTSGLREGSYYLAARATDAAGHVTWSYTPSRITITAPDFATLESGKLTVTGTSGNDRMTVYTIGSNVVTTLNGQTLSFAASSITSTEVYGLEGKDSIDCSSMTTAVYVLGGPNEDNIVGGLGNDTLSGAAHSDTIRGWSGDDFINGGVGFDWIDGNGGNDRLYGDVGNDTIYGSSNIDRIFGGDGDDLLVGGHSNDKIYAGDGNDTLLGQAGSDILDGMDGTDTADTDDSDIRVSIEVLL